MSCLSDIDLATLHQSRLNERVHYKLSCWNRPSVDQQRRNHEQLQPIRPPLPLPPPQQQQPKAKVQADQRRTYGNRKTNKMVADNKDRCIEHTKNGAQSELLAHQSQRNSINSIDLKHEKVSHRSCIPNGTTSVKTTASESCDMIDGKIGKQPTINKFDCNANKLYCDGVAGNESAIPLNDDHFPILRRRRSGTWP